MTSFPAQLQEPTEPLCPFTQCHIQAVKIDVNSHGHAVYPSALMIFFPLFLKT
jgi:hypothetical protein